VERAGRHRDIPANAGRSQPGSVYPLTFVDRIADEKTEQCWKAVHLENEYLRVIMLPRLGGRIHVALDKTNGDGFITARSSTSQPGWPGWAVDQRWHRVQLDPAPPAQQIHAGRRLRQMQLPRHWRYVLISSAAGQWPARLADRLVGDVHGMVRDSGDAQAPGHGSQPQA
jgi:Domain of unknown function (DUF5107)